jgi:hypothetical protein
MMSFPDQLHACHERLVSVCAALPAPYPAFTLFFSVSDGSQRAHVVHARAAEFETAWREGADIVERWVRDHGIVSPWLRIDWVEGASPMDWVQFKTQLTAVKRNYFRLGLAFDKDFEIAFTEQELNANAMLCGRLDHCAFGDEPAQLRGLRPGAFRTHARARHADGPAGLPARDGGRVLPARRRGAQARRHGARCGPAADAGAQPAVGHRPRAQRLRVSLAPGAERRALRVRLLPVLRSPHPHL